MIGMTTGGLVRRAVLAGLLGAYRVPGGETSWSFEGAEDGRLVVLDVRWPAGWHVKNDDPYVMRNADGLRMARAQDRLTVSGTVLMHDGRPTIEVDSPPLVHRPAEAIPRGRRGWLRTPTAALVSGLFYLVGGIVEFALGALPFQGPLFTLLGALSILSGLTRMVEQRRGHRLRAPLGWISWLTRPTRGSDSGTF